MAARTSGLACRYAITAPGIICLRIGDPGIEPGFVPDEVGLGEAEDI